MFSRFLVYLIIVSATVISCQPKQQASQGLSLPSVTVHKVEYTSAPFYDEYPVTINSLNQTELRPQINGYITAIHFKEGDHVLKGERLYSIDQQQYQAAYQQALANQEVQRANLVKAEKDVNRYRELAKKDAVARQLVDNAEANYEAALKQLDAAKATVNNVQTNVRYTSIIAPFDGTIGLSMVKIGAAVSAGQSILNTISSDDPVAGDILIDQKEIFRFTEIQKTKVDVKDSMFTLAFGGKVYPYSGRLNFIDRAVNSQTGTILVRIIFPNSGNTLRPGMTGTLRLLSNNKVQSIVIPMKAVVEQLGEFFVYRVKTDSNKVTQQKVRLGKQINRDVIVSEGLTEGETIVIEGVQNMREGLAIADPTVKK